MIFKWNLVFVTRLKTLSEGLPLRDSSQDSSDTIVVISILPSGEPIEGAMSPSGLIKFYQFYNKTNFRS